VERTYEVVGRRALPVVLAVCAAVADAAGSYTLGLYALLGAVPFASVAALVSFGDYLDARDDAVGALQALLWGLAVCLLVLACAVRSQSIGVPPLAASALVGCLGVFAVKAVVAIVPYVVRLALRPAKP
jgi:hypothetical protein